MSITTAVIFVCFSALQSQTAAVAKALDLDVAVRAAQSSTMPALERDKLVGKEFTGSVTIRTVRLSPDGSAIIEAESQAENERSAVRVRFLTTSLATALDMLSQGKLVRMKARLTAFSGPPTSPVLTFAEMTIIPGN